MHHLCLEVHDLHLHQWVGVVQGLDVVQLHEILGVQLHELLGMIMLRFAASGYIPPTWAKGNGRDIAQRYRLCVWWYGYLDVLCGPSLCGLLALVAWWWRIFPYRYDDVPVTSTVILWWYEEPFSDVFGAPDDSYLTGTYGWCNISYILFLYWIGRPCQSRLELLCRLVVSHVKGLS